MKSSIDHMHVLCIYLNLHHDFVEFNTQSSCFKYPLSCISWHFFSKGSNVSRSSFNGSKSNPHPPNTPAQHPAPGRRDRSKDTTDGGLCYRCLPWNDVHWFHAAYSLQFWSHPFFKSYLEGFFLSFTTVDQATQNYQSTWIIFTKKKVK